jgi:hypothetical protein
MAEYQEEIYIIEKREITDDEDEDQEFEKMRREAEATGELDLPAMSVMQTDGDGMSSDDDLNDFNALKSKTDNKNAKKALAGTKTVTNSLKNATMTSVITQARTLEREVVIDDFIRNFLVKGKMAKTMNVFQQEWYEL